MSAITASCWACQWPDETAQWTCRVCSTPSLRKQPMPKPRNATRAQHFPSTSVPSISAPSLLRLYKLYCYDNASISRALREIGTMSARAPTPEHNIPPLFLLSHALPQAIPNISLAGPEGAYPTMDFNTFNNLTNGVQDLRELRVLLPKMFTRRKHKRGHNCVKCCEAAWANAYFAEDMRVEKQADSDEKKHASKKSSNPKDVKKHKVMAVISRTLALRPRS